MESLNLLLLLPFASAAVIVLFLRRAKWLGAAVSTLSAAACFAIALAYLAGDNGQSVLKSTLPLFSLGGFTMNMGLLFDSLTANMIFVVCGVGFLIHVYSIGYMDDDPAKGRFFAGMSFFMFSMTGIVLASNLFMMFVFWELVGFCSYALIAHYADTSAAREASKKAFIVNRVGDFGFLLGIILTQYTFGTTDFVALSSILSATPEKASTLMGLLILCGFLGKSAQFPLQVWLGDAMAGPTPVSALIHAATMVAAGVFMMVRLSAVGLLTSDVLSVVLVLCSLMSFCAGLWALGQNDIKKILAYSTLAHLGMMGAGIGLGAGLAMFHLTTHAFFKATLFLVAGSIIHACRHEQDIFKMGGLFKRMPITSVVALVATLSIIAAPFFAGNYSKETILATAFAKSAEGDAVYNFAFAMLLGAAFLTPVYMGRLFFNVFFGSPHCSAVENARESSLFMTVPLVILAVYSLGGAWGFVGDYSWLGGKFNALMPSASTAFIGGYLAQHMQWLAGVGGMHSFEITASCITLLGLGVAFAVYGKPRGYDIVERRLPLLYKALNKHGWFDDVYNWYVAKVQQRLAILLATFADLFIVELMCVRGLGIVCAVVGQGVKKLHDCSANSQVKWMVAGVVFVFILVIFA